MLLILDTLRKIDDETSQWPRSYAFFPGIKGFFLNVALPPTEMITYSVATGGEIATGPISGSIVLLLLGKTYISISKQLTHKQLESSLVVN